MANCRNRNRKSGRFQKTATKGSVRVCAPRQPARKGQRAPKTVWYAEVDIAGTTWRAVGKSQAEALGALNKRFQAHKKRDPRFVQYVPAMFPAFFEYASGRVMRLPYGTAVGE